MTTITGESATSSRKPVALWVIAVVAAAAVVLGAVWWNVARSQSSAPKWLFSHTADEGSLIENPDGTYTLTLTGIDPHVMAFTDRPDRDSAIMSTASLVHGWRSLFATSPPNAVLVEHNAQGGADSVVLTLTNPRLTAPSTETFPNFATATLTFDASLMLAEHPEGLTRLTRGVKGSPPETFAKASLFIDDVSVESTTVIPEGWLPVSGDWDGDGGDSVGVFDPETLTYRLYTDPETSVGTSVLNGLPDQMLLQPA